MGQESTGSLSAGSQIGNYTILDTLGAGAMGEVYLAEHPTIGSKVAVKVLAPHLSASPAMGRRFVAEAKAVNRINHPNIIHVFDLGTLQDGRLYMVMEYLEGQELAQYILERAPLELTDAADILRQVTSAMAAAHEAGIVHRDLKPDNIFLHHAGGQRIVKILDFGIAKLTQADTAAHKTATGMVMGTPLYMSPEQAAGRVDDISPRTDIYALGVILYQMLSGSLPIEAPSVPEILVGHMSKAPTPLQYKVSGLPPAVDAVVLRCLEKRPEDRFGTMTEVYHAFMGAIAGLPAGLRAQQRPDAHRGAVAFEPDRPPPTATGPSGAGNEAGASGPVAANATPESGPGIASGSWPGATPAAVSSLAGTTAPPRPRRLPAFLLGLGAAVLLLAGGAGLYFVRSGHGSRQSASDSTASARQGRASRPARLEPRRQPRSMGAGRRAPSTIARSPREVRVRVSWKTRGAQVTAQVGDGPPRVHTEPFDLKVPAGTRVRVAATRRGYVRREVILEADEDQDLDLTLEPLRKGAASRRGHRHRPQTRPAPRPARPRPRRVRLGEGTMKL